MKRLLILILILLVPILQASSELLTKEEIALELGSKTSYTKQEVVNLIHEILQANDDEWKKTQDNVIKVHEDRIELVKQYCKFQIDDAEKNAQMWRTISIIEFAAIIGGSILWAATK